jgi:dual specificity tyrosine-phosphorylation-regulated kinase 2/3/4
MPAAPGEASKDPKQANRHRRAMTAGNGSESDRGPNAAPNLSKKNLQPLRLPPLNLLPLGTPTTSRIASFPAPSVEVDTRQQETPPPKRSTKTPSTPMTASKATFFARSIDEDGWPAFHDFRSSSAHHPVRPGQDGTESKFELGLAAGPPIPIPAAGSHRNHAASPFSSHSLPKLTDAKMGGMEGQNNGLNFSQSYGSRDLDFHMVVPEPSPKVVTQQPVQPMTGLTGAGLATANPSARTSTSDEPGTPASSTSLRRKLSLTWKRSSSKASARIKEALAAEKEENKRQNEMPPPKIPASATWTSRNSSDTGSGRPSLDSRPRKSSNSLSQGSMSLDGETDSNKESHGSSTNHPQQQQQQQLDPPGQLQSQKKSVPRSSSSSILTPVQRMLGGKGSLGALRNRPHGDGHYGVMDKEDAAADRIMEKLSSKRKDFAEAARDVDELRRRAIPAKGYSPREAVYSVNLNIFERGEIVDYKEVFFTGTKNAKKIVGDLEQASTNFGYDDERGDYNIVLGDHLSYRYEVIDVLGKGSFGQVVRCIDHKLGVLVAVKIIRNKKRFHQQALVEVNILQKLREWVSLESK